MGWQVPETRPVYWFMRQFKFDNVLKAVNEHFTIFINESYGQKEIYDILNGVEKVEKAYLR